MPLESVNAIRYFASMDEGGSRPALVQADDGRSYVVKLRGAAQGLPPLVAEIIAGETARTLGIRVPHITLVEFNAGISGGISDIEMQRSLRWSLGTNVGLEFVKGATMFDQAAEDNVPARFASMIVLLDMLTLNVDRTVSNPNLLVANDVLYAIDHGAALYFHFQWHSFAGKSEAALPNLSRHVLLQWATEVQSASEQAITLLTPQEIERIVSLVPDALLENEQLTLPEELRQKYRTFLHERVQHSVHFAKEVLLARIARI